MKTLIEWFEQVVRRLKHRRACKLEARDKEMAELRRWAMQEHHDHTAACQKLIRTQGDLQAALQHNRKLASEIESLRLRASRLEQELVDSPMKAMVREIVREAVDRELQPGGKLWCAPAPQQKGGYQEGRT